VTAPEGHPNPKEWWKHARYMAYACLAGMLLFPLLALAVDGDTIDGIVWPYYLSLGLVVTVYTGGVSVASKWSGKT